MRFAMLGFRQCEACGKELPEELFRVDNSQCRRCAREAEMRNPAVKLAQGITAQPKEAWALDLLKRIGAL